MVLALLVGLTILSGLLLIGGSAWTLILLRSKDHFLGDSGGAEPTGEQLGGDEAAKAKLTSTSAVSAGSGGKGTNLDFAAIKRELKKGHWRTTLPLVLAVFGFLGLLLFGSLALFISLDDILIGSFIAAVAVLAVVRVLIRMIQA